MINKIIISAILLLITPYVAFAVPSISGVSGTITNGQNVTISGSGFGTKSPVAPIIWAPFDSSTASSTLGRATSWQEDSCVEWTSNGRAGGGVKTLDSCNRQNDTAQLGINTVTLGIDYYLNTYNQKTYIFRHRKMVYTNDVNLKSMEMIGADYTTNANWVFNHSNWQWQTQNIDNPGGESFYLDYPSPVENQWATEEIIIQAAASPGTATANVKMYANGVLLGEAPPGFLSSGSTSNSDDLMRRIKPVFHGDYNIGSGGTMADTPEYWDSVYVDNTWSRIIIGNSSTYSSSTVREVQIPNTTWSDSQIQVQINQGTFANNSTAYLYVVDSSGVVSSSREITFGAGSGDGTAPLTTISTSDPSSISSDALTVTGSASDAVGVSGCKWRIGSAPDSGNGTTCTGTTSFSCSTSGYSNGSNTLYVGCYDAAGNYGFDSITVNYTTASGNKYKYKSVIY